MAHEQGRHASHSGNLQAAFSAAQAFLEQAHGLQPVQRPRILNVLALTCIQRKGSRVGRHWPEKTDVNTGELSGLPLPVYRYIKHVLAENRQAIRVMRMTQTGKRCTDVHRERWVEFRAEHVVRPASMSFFWDARARILPLLHLRVRGVYADGAREWRRERVFDMQ